MTSPDVSPQRLQRRRTSAPLVLVLLAGGLGLLSTLVLLRPGNVHAVRVAVAARAVQSGAVVRRADVAFVALRADSTVRDAFVPEPRARLLVGRVATVSMDPGEPFLAAHVAAPATRDGRRAMSIPVERSRAVNGRLAPGDRVDVVAASDERVTIVAAGLEVLDLDDPDRGAFGSRRGEVTITLAVDAQQSQQLTEALADGDFVITRVTGAASAVETPPLMRTRGAR